MSFQPYKKNLAQIVKPISLLMQPQLPLLMNNSSSLKEPMIQSPVFDDSNRSSGSTNMNAKGLFDVKELDLPIGVASRYTNATDTVGRVPQLPIQANTRGNMTSIPQRAVIHLQAPWMTSKPQMINQQSTNTMFSGNFILKPEQGHNMNNNVSTGKILGKRTHFDHLNKLGDLTSLSANSNQYKLPRFSSSNLTFGPAATRQPFKLPKISSLLGDSQKSLFRMHKPKAIISIPVQSNFQQDIAIETQIKQKEHKPSQFKIQIDNYQQNKKRILKAEDKKKTNQYVAVEETEKRQRGKKRERDDVFIQKCNKIIDDCRHKLDLGELSNMPTAEKKRLRNIVSANKNRILRKKEPIFLYGSIDSKDKKFSELVKYMVENLNEFGQITSVLKQFMYQNQQYDQQITQEKIETQINEWYSDHHEKLNKFKQNDLKTYDDDKQQ